MGEAMMIDHCQAASLLRLTVPNRIMSKIGTRTKPVAREERLCQTAEILVRSVVRSN